MSVRECLFQRDLTSIRKEDHLVVIAIQAIEVVRGNDRRFSFGAQFIEDAVKDATGVGIDRIHRLIEEEQIGALDEGTGEHRPLLLTTRKLSDLAIGQVVQVQAVDFMLNKGLIGR